MQAMRDLLRSSLGKSLSTFSPLDRLATAWPVAAGHATAERTSVAELEDGVVRILVPDVSWRNQLEMIAQQLRGDLARISRVPLTDILFVLPAGAEPSRTRAIPSRRKST
jgi:predicted nucleic acid-binding Zn ribbon protein